MDIVHFDVGKPAQRLPSLDALPPGGMVWIDFPRAEATAWAARIEPLLGGVAVDAQHVADSLSGAHPSFFDGTPDYDMLIFEGLGSRDEPLPLETRSASFFLFARVLVTVRADDSVSFAAMHRRIGEGRLRTPASPLSLSLAILDTMVDRFLRIRDALDQRFTVLQDELLDPGSTMNDWRALLDGRREARKLEALSESQMEALDAWRRNSALEWGQHDEVRFRDLYEHINRVLTHASGQERDLEAAVQLHFAAMAHRTNRVVQTLTVMSAIFFPLTLITGIYGMNFDHMPELHAHYGYYTVLGVIVVTGVGMAWYFKRRGLF